MHAYNRKWLVHHPSFLRSYIQKAVALCRQKGLVKPRGSRSDIKLITWMGYSSSNLPTQPAPRKDMYDNTIEKFYVLYEERGSEVDQERDREIRQETAQAA